MKQPTNLNMSPVKDRHFWETAKLNNATYIQYYNRLLELSVSMFDWKNLPSTVDPRFLELALFTDGMAVFFQDDVVGNVALRTMIGGRLNLYNIPTERTAYAANGYNRKLDESNSVLIFNNLIHTNSMLDVEMFARRLSEIDRTVDVNIIAQKTPILLKCPEKVRLTLKNLYKQYSGNEPFIFGDNSLDVESVKVLNTDAPFLADKLLQIKATIWNEALTYLGISNINVNKRERLITDEVMRSMGGTIASRYSRLESRRQACRKINEMFGLNIWCDYREDFQQVEDNGDKITAENDTLGGVENE